jgi:hypothetical protein
MSEAVQIIELVLILASTRVLMTVNGIMMVPAEILAKAPVKKFENSGDIPG